MSITEVLATAVRGGAAGAAGTVAMSGLMLAAGRVGLVGRQPPEAITRTAVRRATGVEPRGATADALASAAHVGFGVASGVLYAALPAPAASGPGASVPPLVRGATYGLGVWAVSYLGWVPRLLGALPPAERDRRDRVAVMVAAHLVYGGVLGVLHARWTGQK
jgi:hypothetical protein